MTGETPHAQAVKILTNKKLWLAASEPKHLGEKRAVIGYKTTVEKNVVAILCNLLGNAKITGKDEESNPGNIIVYMKPSDLESARKPYVNQNND